MKKPLLILAFCLLPVFAFGADVTLVWDTNTEPDVVGYRIYQAEKQGDKSTDWAFVAETGLTTYVVTIPDKGGFVWYVSAFNTEGLESQPSNLVIYRWVPPGRVKNLTK